MKTLIPILFIIILLFSCKKEEVTTYQIVNNMEYYPGNIFDGTMREVIVYYYNGTQITSQKNISLIAPGENSGLIDIDSKSKIKVTFKIMNPGSFIYFAVKDLDKRFYVEEFTNIEAGKNNIITIKSSDTLYVY